MGKGNEKEIFEFPDSTVNVNVKFKESDLQNLEESDGSSDANRITYPPHLIFDNLAHATASLIFDCRRSSELRMPSLAWMERVTPSIRSHGSKYLYQALAAKFNPTVSVLVSAGFIE
ncbi:unnamed protein product [Nippostrongylus brasiliensis]|uniref:Rhodanese domain-containing protein n=1 Tax=Nippostrongylus brasiliensis TaxID=27835 RepID=A0A0N4YEL7_NIPBR|nr:unnamed protein product [Nippostrongylus brasiliensis]